MEVCDQTSAWARRFGSMFSVGPKLFYMNRFSFLNQYRAYNCFSFSICGLFPPIQEAMTQILVKTFTAAGKSIKFVVKVTPLERFQLIFMGHVLPLGKWDILIFSELLTIFSPIAQ
ncbi:hypothetical protein ACJX0J_031709, partial [Zea mays]